jgi:hypothetical protein
MRSALATSELIVTDPCFDGIVPEQKCSAYVQHPSEGAPIYRAEADIEEQAGLDPRAQQLVIMGNHTHQQQRRFLCAQVKNRLAPFP